MTNVKKFMSLSEKVYDLKRKSLCPYLKKSMSLSEKVYVLKTRKPLKIRHFSPPVIKGIIKKIIKCVIKLSIKGATGKPPASPASCE